MIDMNKSYCKFCGGKINKNEIFCKGCGAKIDKDEEIKDAVIVNDKSRKDTKYLWSMIILLLLAIIIISGLIIILK